MTSSSPQPQPRPQSQPQPPAQPHPAGPQPAEPHPAEPHAVGTADRLNRLRAGVLGANDGIVSVAAVVVGVAGATTALPAIIAAGSAALLGGAISMALGEYVSVSSSRDTTRALIDKERHELDTMPETELAELTDLYRAKGLTEQTARAVAQELTAHDALAAHLEAELNIDEHDVANPWSAAFASALSFLIGAILPMIAIVLPPEPLRVPVCFAAVLVALVLTGAISATVGGTRRGRATLRVVIGGALALAATFLLGRLLGTAGLGA